MKLPSRPGSWEPRFAVLGDLHGEEPLMDHLSEPIDRARPVEVDACRAFMLKRVEGRARAEHVERPRVGMPPDRLEERVAGRDPLQLLGLGDLAVGGAARIAVSEGRELPVRVLLVTPKACGRACRLKGVRHVRDRLHREGVRTRPPHEEIARWSLAQHVAPAPAPAARSASRD